MQKKSPVGSVQICGYAISLGAQQEVDCRSHQANDVQGCNNDSEWRQATQADSVASPFTHRKVTSVSNQHFLCDCRLSDTLQDMTDCQWRSEALVCLQSDSKSSAPEVVAKRTQRGFFFRAYFVGHNLSISIMI